MNNTSRIPAVRAPSLARPVIEGIFVTISLAMLCWFMAWMMVRALGVPSVSVGAYEATRSVYWGARVHFWQWMASPWFWIGIPLLVLLQTWRPARPGEKVAWRGMLEDAAWTFVSRALRISVFALYLIFLSEIFSRYVSDMTVDFAVEWHPLAVVLVGYLMADLLGWLHHFVRHHVKICWSFHAVHHSQRQMNPFTVDRVHPVDFMFAQNVKFLPFFWLQSSLDIVLAYMFFHQFHDALNHSSIRTNLGVLRYVFVTPQSHRIHHSADPRHFDRNFGVSLSIWDHIFGTQYRKYDEYPETGVPESDMPARLLNERSLWRRVLGGLVWPFLALFRSGHGRLPGWARVRPLS